jgi:hypothetical protein
VSAQAKRTPGEVLREARRADSHAKRARVLAALDAMKADGTPITFTAVAKAAGVSTWLVYAQGVREHVEAAIKGQGAAGRRGRAAGAGASAASLATDLELVRAQNKALRAERDRLKAAVQRGLGDRLEATGSRELAERVGELLGAVERLTAERDQARAQASELQSRLEEAEDELVAAREVGRQLMRQANLPAAGGGRQDADGGQAVT